jgi:hypothetical protein
MTPRSRALLAALAAAALGAAATPARATFVADPNPGGDKMYIDAAHHGASGFLGYVGANDPSGDHVGIAANAPVDTGSGYANITPSGGGPLTTLTFAPANDTLFGDFSFRGQLNRAGYTGTLDVLWTDSLGVSGTVEFTNLPAEADFGRIGIHSTDGETLKSVEIRTTDAESFKEVKEIDFSYAPESPTPVPEPASLGVLCAGLAGLLGAQRRRSAL